jgi:OST3 / OST6 family, transporter family
MAASPLALALRRCLACVLTMLVLSAERSAAASNDDRIAKLDQVRRSKPDGVLGLNADTFRKYIEAAPSTYSLFVLFIADASMCKPCVPMRKELGRAAAAYYGLPERQMARHPVFFAELKLSLDDRAFLNDYSIEHVPIFHHFGPTSRRLFPAALVSFPSDGYAVEKLGVSSNAIKAFVNAKAGSRMQVVRGDYQIPFASTVRAMMPALVSAAGLVAATAVYLGWVNRPMFWFVLCVVVYMYSVGGGHYTWINNSPFAVVNSHGVAQYISDGSRNQYVAEGMLVSVTCSAISAIVIGINELPRLLAPGVKQATIGFAMVFVVFACTTLLLSLYTLKMPAYLRYEA